jgi:hypothetical protein
MPHVFISYSRRDRARAASLVRNLQLAGVPVFQDVLSIGPKGYNVPQVNNRGVPAGSSHRSNGPVPAW